MSVWLALPLGGIGVLLVAYACCYALVRWIAVDSDRVDGAEMRGPAVHQ